MRPNRGTLLIPDTGRVSAMRTTAPSRSTPSSMGCPAERRMRSIRSLAEVTFEPFASTMVSPTRRPPARHATFRRRLIRGAPAVGNDAEPRHDIGLQVGRAQRAGSSVSERGAVRAVDLDTQRRLGHRALQQQPGAVRFDERTGSLPATAVTVSPGFECRRAAADAAGVREHSARLEHPDDVQDPVARRRKNQVWPQGRRATMAKRCRAAAD